MTLEEQTQLLNDLIRENTDVTIKEFLSVMAEIEAIRKNAPKPKKGPTVEEVIEAANKILAEKPKPIYKTTEAERKYYQALRIRR